MNITQDVAESLIYTDMPEKSYTDRILETLTDLVSLMRSQNDRNFDELKLAISQLTTQQKQSAINIDKLIQAIKRQTAAIERQNAAIDGHLAVAQAQSANIVELTKLLTVAIANKN